MFTITVAGIIASTFLVVYGSVESELAVVNG